MTTNSISDTKLYQLILLFQIGIAFFSYSTSFAVSDEKYEEIKKAHEEMHKWAPVAGRLYMK